ncbi:MAG: hypothetical protein ACAI43_20215 [Phycisphaerae bacterium]
MKRRLLITAVAVLAIGLWIWSPWRANFGYHFSFPLPPSAKVIQYHHSAGRDSGDEFEFAVTDDALRDAIIKEWNLTSVAPGGRVMSFARVTGAPWWPGDKLQELPERYGRIDERASRYWSLWVDRQNGRLYAEYGNW